ncbi:MAG: aminoglycoside phosphotransferase family protein [Lachnospiraceae bacterium]|nr:aminoglycoside phosphotransferase family protein [Lachnospiraceae bacterium]
MEEMIRALFAKCGLGRIGDGIVPVSGGLMHKMFRVATDHGVYAVKCLNPEIMKRPGVLDNYARAEALESILEENGIPIVPALSFDGRKMPESDGRYFQVFKWQEGHITDWDDISEEQCRKAGEILGKIHAIDPRDAGASGPELSAIDFRAYLETAIKKESGIAAVLEENIGLLEDAQKKLNDARTRLPALEAITDDDMDPKNVMWDKGEARVIDLECLERGNPVASCLSLSLQWAGTVNGKYSGEKLAAFFRGYLGAYDNGFRSYDELFGLAYVWVEWLEYNLKRALGTEGAEEDRKPGETETANTIDRIRYLHSLEKEICAVLADLPALSK